MSVDTSPAVTTVLAPVAPPVGAPRAGAVRWSRRAVCSFLALLAVYAGLSFLDDPRGTLGTDTGGKLATLHVMEERGALDPDLGYWAEAFDPDGSLHPLYYTERAGDRWVNVTTLPMLYAAYPLYELGGERAILLLPMLGAVLAAMASRALARRLWGGSRWDVFWVVGLATPLAVYALDFWEHSLGVASVLWAGVLLLDVHDGRAGGRAALAAGALFGLAATMRTEALVYALLLTALVGAARARTARRAPVRQLIATGVPVACGLGAVLLANQLLERATLGEGLRAARATGTAVAAASDLGVRVKEAITTTVGVNRFARPFDWLVGAVIVVALALAASAVTGSRTTNRRLAIGGLAVAAVLYAIRFADGVGFVPGLLSASPLAAAGVALAWSDPRGRRLAIAALVPLPLVWLFQFSGGAEPQWGGRYVLTTGALLAVAGVVGLARSGRVILVAVVLVGLAVTGCGVAWLSHRSHSVADAMERLGARSDEAVLSLEAHLLREGGAFYDPDRRWLTATNPAEVDEALGVLRRASVREVAVISAPGATRPRRLGPFVRRGSESLELLPGLRFRIATYERG